MKSALAALLLGLALASTAHARTLFQCAVDNVRDQGARVNVIETNGTLRANLLFGTTVSGTMFQLAQTTNGYQGAILGRPEFTILLRISNRVGNNSNISGYQSELTAVYPTSLNSQGYQMIQTRLICGKKISGRWN